MAVGKDVPGEVSYSSVSACLREAKWECLYSGLAWEIVIVDDASPDGTQEIAKQLAKVYGEDKIVRFLCHARF